MSFLKPCSYKPKSCIPKWGMRYQNQLIAMVWLFSKILQWCPFGILQFQKSSITIKVLIWWQSENPPINSPFLKNNSQFVIRNDSQWCNYKPIYFIQIFFYTDSTRYCCKHSWAAGREVQVQVETLLLFYYIQSTVERKDR